MSNTKHAQPHDLTPDMIRTAAIANGVCARPIIKLPVDTVTGREQPIPIDCGSTTVSGGGSTEADRTYGLAALARGSSVPDVLNQLLQPHPEAKGEAA